MLAKVDSCFFMLCNNRTKERCLDSDVFAAENVTRLLKDINIGNIGFLYNLTTRRVHGIFKAKTKIAQNTNPRDWFDTQYPWQMRVEKIGEPKDVPKARMFADHRLLGNKGWPRTLYLGGEAERVVGNFENALMEFSDGGATQSATNDLFAPVNSPERAEATIRTEDGHMVRSRAEAMIDNYLYNHSIVHAYERKVPVEEELYCDFYLPRQRDGGGGVYIEYWGLENDPKYRRRKEQKIALYKKHALSLIELTDKEVANVDDHLPRLLRPFGINVD